MVFILKNLHDIATDARIKAQWFSVPPWLSVEISSNSLKTLVGRAMPTENRRELESHRAFIRASVAITTSRSEVQKHWYKF